MPMEELINILPARQRRRLTRSPYNPKELKFLTKCAAAKKDLAHGDSPAVVRTHLRNFVVTPALIGNLIGVYNGKVFNQVEIKPEMIGRYLGEFSITYKPVGHGRAGINASKFIPLK